uniref:Chromosome partition protein Smc n=1 Tax=Schlesneria paludicola TaxID=360056 RepID=A0A7C4QUD4_9PLAN
MNRLSRVLAVFVTVASLGYAAFVLALVNGGPNWEALAGAKSVTENVAIAPPQLPDGPYTATHRLTGDQLKSSKVLAEVVIASQKRVLDDLNKQIQDLEQVIEPLKQRIAAAQRDIDVDRSGLNARSEAWTARLRQLAQELDAVNADLQARVTEATQVGRDLEERRFEVLRLQNQLELLRDDLFAAQEQRRALEDELTQLLEAQQRLERRRQQLQERLGEKY